MGANAFQYYENGEYKNLDCTIYVPSVALDKYKNAENWSGYNIAANKNELLYTSTDGNIVTPYEATAFSGANIISNTYENGQGIITFDAPVTEIGSSAFRSCSSLTSVTIPNSVTEIGSSAFAFCSSLTSVTIPDSVTEIGDYAFYNCSSLTSVIIPNSVTTIGGNAFRDCSSLTSVTIPDSVTTLGANPFRSCSKLTEFNGKFASADKRCLIVDGVLNSFAIGCGLTEYAIPNSVTKIVSFAFQSCSSLTSVTIPDSVTYIGGNAFRDCSSLTSVTIGNNVTTLGTNPFQRCSKLTEFNGKFASADKRCLIVDGVLKSFAPAGLTEYTIPDSVTKIGDSAFEYCRSLTSVTIPNSVTEIEDDAFYTCSSLKSVYLTPTTPPQGGDDMFYYNASGRKIYVPRASESAYEAAGYWRDYAADIEPYDF